MTAEQTTEIPSTDGVNFDEVTKALAEQVVTGIREIADANVILLSSDGDTGNRAIDTAFKEGTVEDKESLTAWAKYEKARDAAKEALAKARNTYRVNVLDEEESSEEEVDKAKVQETRKMVLTSLGLIDTFATMNNLSDVVTWAQGISVPQVGRKGSSGVGGARKPRAFVSFNDATHDSFGEAAKALSAALSTEDKKVVVSAGDLAQAWSDNGEKDSFSYQGIDFKVALKAKKSDAPAA